LSYSRSLLKGLRDQSLVQKNLGLRISVCCVGLRDQRLVQKNLGLRISGLLSRVWETRDWFKRTWIWGSQVSCVCLRDQRLVQKNLGLRISGFAVEGSERPETGSKESGSENLRSLSKVWETRDWFKGTWIWGSQVCWVGFERLETGSKEPGSEDLRFAV